MSGLSLTSYANFRRLDQANRLLWRSKYEKRTGRKKGRGWTKSREFGNYLKSREARAERLREENLFDYVKNIDRIEIYEGGAYQRITFREIEIYNSILEIIPQIQVFELLAVRTGKRFESAFQYGNQYYVGLTSVRQKLKQIADQWRKYMESLPKKTTESAAGMKYVRGEVLAVEYRRTVFVRVTMKIVSKTALDMIEDEQERDNYDL